ncbi:GGDEF domain-containing protein [Paucibacter soli]|uniref:GGDEF domain-containing protein n=1 Tax=Paucibacter soli TaxID=3133433 RepID=UPI0030A0D094
MSEVLQGFAPNFLSAQPAGRLEQRLAQIVMLASALTLVALLPFAQRQLPQVWAFIPIYESALILSDIVTAALLIGQFMISRSRAMRVLVGGYLFTGLMASAHMLSFPGLFAEQGLLGGDKQTTAWLYMFWHAGFPLCVIAYCGLRGEVSGGTRRALLQGMCWVVGAVLALVLLATRGITALPAIMVGNHYSPAMLVVVSSVWLLSMLALLVLWRRRMRSVLDLWLVVVMGAWLSDIALSAVFNAGRFDLGFYAGRIYGLLAASMVLLILLVENGWLYARLLQTTAELQRLMSADALTGIANRRAFDEALAREWRRAQRRDSALSLLMLDVDHFKLYNDRYGHVAGDACLRAVAAVLAHAAQRAGEIAARYGGEEFAILLPELDAQAALQLGQRICQGVANLGIAHAASPTAGHVTVSLGVASLHPHMQAATLVQRADAALYAAKLAGRNRVWLADDEQRPGEKGSAAACAGLHTQRA